MNYSFDCYNSQSSSANSQCIYVIVRMVPDSERRLLQSCYNGVLSVVSRGRVSDPPGGSWLPGAQRAGPLEHCTQRQGATTLPNQSHVHIPDELNEIISYQGSACYDLIKLPSPMTKCN